MASLLVKDLITGFTAKSDADKAASVSAYNPTGPQRTRIVEIMRDFVNADTIRSRGYEEFNGLTLMDVTNRDRRAFNNYIPPKSQDPDDAWRAQTKRPISRNKAISIAAHVTSGYISPTIVAQNDNDEEDRDASVVMRDVNNWANEQSKFASVLVQSVIKALVDPATILYEGYAHVMREIKEIQPDGTWVKKEVVDDLYSGFLNAVVPVDELYIANFYESDIQKQQFLVWRKVISYEEARTKYSKFEDFKYVQPGLKIFYVDDRDGFYESYDESLQGTLVEEVIYYNRFADLEIPVLNGVLLGDPDRPIQRIDKKYPFAKKGYEMFGGTDCFYYKSLIDKLSSDQEVIDRLYNMIIDGSFLQIMPPSVVTGDEEIGSSVIYPGGITVLAENSKFQTINTNNNLQAGLSVLQKTEDSLSESSTDLRQQGNSGGGTPATAFEVSRLEANAKTILGLFGKMITDFVEDFGNLRVSTILQHVTVAEVAELTGAESRLKFRNLLIPANEGTGKKTSKIEFSMDAPSSPEDRMSASFKLLEREHKTGSTIYQVNPELFRRNKYMFKVVADFAPSTSESVKKALNLEAYDRMINNPYLDPELVTSDFLVESYKPGESDKYKRKAPAQGQQQPGAQPGNSNVTSQILNKAQAGAIG